MSRYEYAVFVRKGQELEMVGIGPVEEAEGYLRGDLNIIEGFERYVIKYARD